MSDVGWSNQIHSVYGTDPTMSGVTSGGVVGAVGGQGRPGVGTTH
jgi:hypothetical protein